MTAWDIKLFYTLNDLAGKSELWDRVFIFAGNYAVIIFSIILAFYFFINRRAFWVAVFSAALSRGIFTEVIRYLYNRPRPFVALENVRVLIEKNGQEPSFPSGHAAFLFAIAFAVLLFNKKHGLILFIAAAFFTVVRVIVGVHYPLDIVGGLLVAAFSVALVRRFFKKTI